MSTNPTPTAKPTPAELAELLRDLDNHGNGGHFIGANCHKAAATIRELSAKVEACEGLADEWETTTAYLANGKVMERLRLSAMQDRIKELRAALSRTPDAP